MPPASKPSITPQPKPVGIDASQQFSPPSDPSKQNPASASLRGGGSYGLTPQMTGNMTFRELGSLGLRAWSGWVREEFLTELIGRQGAQKYREMSDNNPIVGAIIYAIKSTMRKVEWRVTPAGAEKNERTDPKAQQGADFVESCMHDMSHSWEDLIDENLSMLTYGYAPHEIVYKKRSGRNPGADPTRPGHDLPESEYDDGLIGWRRIPVRGQDTVLKWFFDENGQVKGMTQMPWVGPMIDLPIEKMLLFRPSSHKNNPEGRSILRTCYLSYYFVKRLQEMEAIVGERLGGVPVLQVPGSIFDAADAGDADAKAALETYKKIATNVRVDEQMGIVLPSDVWMGVNGSASQAKQFEFSLVTPTGRPMGGFDFDKTIERYSTYMMTSVMADFLSLGHQARGTQSLAVSKVDMFFQAIEGYLNGMAEIYNRYALPRLWKLNGMDYNTMPKIVPDLAQRVDLDVLSNFVLRMSQSGMPLFPNEDLQSYILDAAGLPDVTDERALQAAGLTDDQLDQKDEQADAVLENTKNPPQAKPGAPGSNFSKMLMASTARRMIKLSGPKYGVDTRKAVSGGQGASPFEFGTDDGETWFDHVCYIADNENVLKSVLAGEFDDMTDAVYGQAVEYTKQYVEKYSDDQPRVPKGEPGGGEWTHGGYSDRAGRTNAAHREGKVRDLMQRAKDVLTGKQASDLFHYYDLTRLLRNGRASLYERKMNAIRSFVRAYPDWKGRETYIFDNLLPDYRLGPGSMSFKRLIEKFNPFHVLSGEHGGEFDHAHGGGMATESLMMTSPGGTKWEVLVNPTERDVQQLGKESEFNEVRIVTDDKGNLFAWKAEDALHGQFMDAAEERWPNINWKGGFTPGETWVVSGKKPLRDVERAKVKAGLANAGNVQKIDELIAKSNPYHVLHGENGGEFTSASGVGVASLAEAERRGVWNFRIINTSESYGQKRVTYEIKPNDIPDRWQTFERPITGTKVYYDPALARPVDGYIQPIDAGKRDIQAKPEAGVLYRGMSWEEYQLARKQGYFQSAGDYNIGDAQKGLSYFSTDPKQAQSYASGFAPWQYMATPGRPAVVVAITDRGFDRFVSQNQPTEIGLRGQVPFSAVQTTYVGSAYDVSPGKVDVIYDRNGGAKEGSRFSPSVGLVWSEYFAKYNPNHVQSGEHGGEFTSGPDGGAATEEDAKRLGQISKEMARRMHPEGFDTSPNAPNTFDDLVKHWNDTHRMTVYNGASDKTIFGSAEENFAFRAWHDTDHLRLMARFTPEGEAAVARAQADDLRRIYGDTPAVARMIKLLDAEINGQVKYALANNGAFPVDQKRFDFDYLANPEAAVKQVYKRGEDRSWGRLRDGLHDHGHAVSDEARQVARDLQERHHQHVRKYNQRHEPAGTPKGGQFAHSEFEAASPQEFIEARDKSKRLGFFTPLTPADLKDYRLFMNRDRTVGVAISPQGDIQNAFNNGGPPGSGVNAVRFAISRGGRTLDAFDGYLPTLYKSLGFEEYTRVPFSRDLAPPAWDYKRYGEPDIVFMRLKQ